MPAADQALVSPNSAKNGPKNRMGRHFFRKQISSRLLPALRAASPDLIFISMGFDGAEGDVGNSHLHLDGNPGGLDLRGEDYAWATDEICAVADRCCDGRVVSVLEGGYGMPERRVVNGVNVNSLDRTALADNCCAHVRALVGSDSHLRSPLSPVLPPSAGVLSP